jgi:cytochrome c peroxidase
MLYESTLVSDDSPVDRFLAGDRTALGAPEQQGLDVFRGKGRCTECHNGPALSNATVVAVAGEGGNPLTGFSNTGVRPVAEDGGDILQGNGFFKTPGLHNVELNAPYFHNGDQATLRQVVEFYNRGGDFPSGFTNDEIRVLGLSESDKSALVAFMVALTDERVRWERAPFDHPSLTVPNGPKVPAVGSAGRSAAVQTFLGMSPYNP